jgi:DNA-binding CsgD family transcriptional regulator
MNYTNLLLEFWQISSGYKDSVQMMTQNPILTKEERDILVLSALHPNSKHLSNNEISQRLGITVTRAKTLIHQACLKLGADNKNEAVLMAMRQGEIQLNELLSLDELADILRSLDPAVLWTIANFVRHNRMRRTLPEKGEQFIRLDRRLPGILTNRERDVLILASYGLTNIEMAKKLCMSTSAVRTFLNRAFTKLGASKKADAVQLALKQGEISVSEISPMDELAYYLTPLGAETIEKLAQILDEKLEKEPISIGNTPSNIIDSMCE